MVEELKLAIKIDDASIEQSLLKQFANAQKMADKVVLDFKNVNFDDKQIEAKFKEMQKKAGQNPIDLTIGGNTLDMLGQIDKRLTEIFSIGNGKSFIDSSSIDADIGKIENKINELNKNYEEAQKKLSSIGSGNISGKDVNLVDNEEFKKLSQEVSELKNQFDDLKTHMQLLDDYTVPTDRFFELQSQIETTTVKVSDLVEEFAKLSNAQKTLSSTPQESNISSEVSAFQQQEKVQKKVTQSIQEQNKAIDESIKKTLTLNDVRQKQWEIIQKTNPKEEGTNSTWVDKPEDAKTFYEVNHKDSDYPFNENYSDDWTVKDKMNVEATGKITVYSSYPIEDGNWVTPSKEEGLSYAGSGKLYYATMDPRDIAWVDAGQGQVAHISDELKEVIDLSTKAEIQVQSIDNNTNKTGEQSTLNALDDTIAKYETIVSLVKEYYDLSNNKKYTIGISSDDERISEIRKQLKSYTKNPDYNGEYKMGFGGSGKNIFAKSVDLSQEEMLQEICNMLGVEIPKNADKAKEAIKEVASATATTEPTKDAIPDSSTNTKPETEGMEQVEKAIKEAVQAKKDFATANEGVQSSIDGSENPLKLEAELMEQIAKSAREAADAKKEFVEANKKVKDSANKSNNDLAGGHSENAEPSGVKKYKKKGYKAHDTGNHDNERKVSNKAELGKALKDLQSEIIASIDESTSFVKEVTDFYDSQDNLVKTQMKVGDKNGNMRTYTTSYSMDKDDNATAWTSHIETQKYQDQNKIIQEQTKNLQKLSVEKQKAAESERKSTVNQASKDQLEAWKQIQRIRKEIAGTSNDKLIEQLEQEKKTYQEQYLTAAKILKNNSDLYNSEQRLNELKKISLKTTQQIESSQQRQLNGYDNKLSGYQDKVGGYATTINKFGNDGWTSPEYLDKVQKARKALKLYQEAIDELKANPDLINKESLANVERLGKAFEDVAFDIKNMTAAQKGYTQLGAEKALDKISQMVKENSKMSRQAKADIKAWYDQIASGNPSASLDVILGKVEEIVRKEKEVGRGGKSMWDKIADKVVFGYAAQLASYFLSFSDFIRYGQQAISIVVDLNTQITELAKVSEQTSSQIYSDFSSYADIAKDVGGTISDTISATSDWARNGYGIPDSKELARVALLYKNVGDGINIDEANESLISTLRGFKLEADQAEHIIDVFNEVSNNESISSAGIGNALQRSAASFNAANTSLEKSVALVTATNSVLQDPEKVGNMWKTKFYCLYVQKCA